MKKICMLSLSLLVLFTQSFPLGVLHANDLDCSEINYRIERHLKLIDVLNKLSKQGKIRAEIIKTKKPACSNCSHELLKLCVKKMEQDFCLDPVVETWRLFNSCYLDIEAELFLQEFSSMVCAVSREYVSALSSCHHEVKNKQQERQDDTNASVLSAENAPVLLPTVSLQEIFNLYIKIAKLPISEILEKLDELYYALVDLMDEYGLQQEQSWLDWLKVNWWIPPVAVTCVVLVFTKKSNSKDVAELLFGTQKLSQLRTGRIIA